jgi:hypothetical protein
MIVATGAMCSTQRRDREIPGAVGRLSLPRLHRVLHLELRRVRRSHRSAFASEPVGHGWFKAGITYAGYNVATVPAVFSASVI